MREILFRGKRLDNGEWVEGAFCPKNSEGDIPCIIVYNGTLAGWWFEVDPATVGQFIGLMDRNGKKIFEGDILFYQVGESGYYCSVSYGNFNCSCCDGVYGWYLDGGDIRDLEIAALSCLEVVSTIHDNPELLEGGQA